MKDIAKIVEMRREKLEQHKKNIKMIRASDLHGEMRSNQRLKDHLRQAAEFYDVVYG